MECDHQWKLYSPIEKDEYVCYQYECKVCNKSDWLKILKTLNPMVYLMDNKIHIKSSEEPINQLELFAEN